MSGSRNPNLGVMATAPDDMSGEAWRKNLGRTVTHLGLPRWDDWWTGLAPDLCPGFEHGKLHSLTIPNLATCTRQAVLDYFNNTWTLNELLFSSLIGDEAFYRPPYHGLRHPLIFYYVHPSVLYVGKLRLAGLLPGPINPYFESLFETGVDEMSWDDMSKNVIEWPSVDDALQYRRQVYAAVKGVIESHPGLEDGHSPVLQDNPLWALFMGFEHERIHLETSSVLIRELPVYLVSRPFEWPDLAAFDTTGDTATTGAVIAVGASGTSEQAHFPPAVGRNYPENHMVDVAPQVVHLGKQVDWPVYGWDNEYGERTVSLSQFSASRFVISNGEFWQFVADGGYHQEENWTETGWKWRSFRNIKWPTFWVTDGPAGAHQYRLRTCFEIVPMQWSWPAVVNYHEAKAYCRWKSDKDGRPYRLITEAEHQALRQVCQYDNNDVLQLLPGAPYNTNLAAGSEQAVDMAKSGPNGEFCDLFGNVWQWCEDHFNKFDGFKVHRYYDDFSTPCFDGQHQMIIGGSFVSTGDEATPWARFHFRPHFFQHAGFRLVHDSQGSGGGVLHINEAANANPYETESIFNEYMTLHYASAELQMPYESGPRNAANFPQRCADLVSEWCEKLSIEPKRALDVGCAVGGASFRLAETFGEVVAVDLSGRFIDAAQELKSKHTLAYMYKVEAEIFASEKAIVNAEAAARVDFMQADACALPATFVDFDAVLMANLLCRLPNPASCLRRMWGSRGIVRPGGLLVTVSPFTWMDAYTQKDLWLGGYKDDQGAEHYSEDGLKQMLSQDFELLESREMPLIIREHRRKYQYIVSQAMVWRRR